MRQLRHLGGVRAEEVEVSILANLFGLLNVGEVGTLVVSGQWFKVIRMANSRTFVLRSEGGEGIANGSSAEVAQALMNKVQRVEVLKVG